MLRTLYLLVVLLVAACSRHEEGISLNLLGDSHIARFDDKFWLPSITTVNYGIGGQQLHQLSMGLKDHQGAVSLLEIGTNDIIKKLQAGMSDSLIIAGVSSDFRKLIDTAAIVFKRAYICEIIPLAKDYVPGRSANEIYRAVNVNINSYARGKQNCYIIPVTALLDNNGFVKSIFVSDGLHLNDNGYRVLANAISLNVH